tara:strand:+ start:2892 stop:3479 length:588 start_codon:yes stop_codon:yes gene_type:complete
MKNIIAILIFIFFQSSNIFADESNKIKRITVGSKDAKITIIIYESLTCSHCANFHTNVLPKLKEEFIDNGIVKIEFRHFPLDVAALNAAKLSQCKNEGNTKILDSLYLNQSKWRKGNTIEDVNQNLKNLLKSKGFNLDFNKCTSDESIQDFILNDKVEGIKKFKVNATPTIIINDKKFEKPLNYKNLKKTLEKMI